MVWIWAVVFIVTVVLEVITAELASIWFSVGALVSLILSLLNVGSTAQIIIFAVISVIMFICLRPICMKLLKNTDGKTNVDSIVGTTHKLIKEIKQDSVGEIKINGITWRVVSKNNDVISIGENVKIVEVHGNKLIVEKGE